MLEESIVKALRNAVLHDVRDAMLKPETQVRQPLGRHRRRRRGVEVSAQPASIIASCQGSDHASARSSPDQKP